MTTNRMNGKNVVVVGGSVGVGRVIVAQARDEGAQVLAVARRPDPLSVLAGELPGIATLAIDAASTDAPDAVFGAVRPDVLVLCGGAGPTVGTVQELDWEGFTSAWENDVQASFRFCKAAILSPLAPGSTVILISSGAAIGGSPLSGGYAGAKRMQMLLANYCQKESDRLGLGIRFLAVVPMRPMMETERGQTAVQAYSKYLGISVSDFVGGMDSPQTPEDVAEAVISLATEPRAAEGVVFLVSGTGVDAMQ